jgi:two-component system, NarL family, nitrate/nitrite response regulator NarL
LVPQTTIWDVRARRTPLTRVVIGDRHAPTRLGARLALGAVGYDVLEECASAEAAIAAAEGHRPDICLVDLGLFGKGAAAGAVAAKFASATRVVIVADSAEPDDVLDAIEGGATGFVLADTTPERLAQHMADAAEGHLALSPALVRPLVQRLRNERDRLGLTAREGQVMRLLRTSMSTKQVAQRLGVSPVTVRRHASSAARKLAASSPGETTDGNGVQASERR